MSSIGSTAKSAWAFDFDLTRHTEYFGAQWTHYTPEGFLLTTLYADTAFGNVRSVGVGHHFDSLLVDDWTFYVSANNTTNGWEPGCYLEKIWARNYRVRFSVQPLTHNKTLYVSGNFFSRSVFIGAGYNFDREEIGLSGSYRLWDNATLTANVYRDQTGSLTGIGGLTIYFVTGSPAARRHQEEKAKPIEWLE